MHPARVLEVINNARVPEAKRKFWPKWSIVFVSAECAAVDVVQYFEQPSIEDVSRDHKLYPNTAYFFAIAGESYLKLEELVDKLQACRDAFEPKVLTLLGQSPIALQIGGEWVKHSEPSTGAKPPG